MRLSARRRLSHPAGQPRGFFIVLDGADGSGKTTQIALLARRLRRGGYAVVVEDFPQYRRSFFGPLIARMLAGEFGPVGRINPYLASLPYAGDRWLAAPRIQRNRARGKIILANRFTSASEIHQGAKFRTRPERQAYLDWLRTLEFDILGLPRPNLILFLDVPTRVSQRLLRIRERWQGTARRQRDRSEKDVQHQQAAYRQAIRLVSSEPGWQRIACTRGATILPPEVIAERVWDAVRSRLPR